MASHRGILVSSPNLFDDPLQFRSAPAIDVAGYAQIVRSRKIQHHGVVGRTATPMATETVQCEIPVTRIRHFLPDRMGGMCLPLVAAPAEFDARRCFEKKHLTGTMR